MRGRSELIEARRRVSRRRAVAGVGRARHLIQLSPSGQISGERAYEPARVVETAKCLANLHGKELDEAGRITTANFERLFNVNSREF